jgi:hypothetical protein
MVWMSLAILLSSCRSTSRGPAFSSPGKLGQSEALNTAILENIRVWEFWELKVKRGLERFNMDREDAELVAATLSQFEGALLLARTYQSDEPFAARRERGETCRELLCAEKPLVVLP